MNLKMYDLAMVLLAGALFFSGCSDSETKSTGTTTDLKTAPDTTPPVITLLGQEPLYVAKDSTFVDPGVSAVDERDGEVSVVTTGSVDMATEGRYTLRYKAVDAAGNEANATRTVIVVIEKTLLYLSDREHGYEPWITDGTVSGTYLLADLNQAPKRGYYSGCNVRLGDAVYFSAEYEGDVELWKSDGSVAGTVRVKDINLHGSSRPGEFMLYDGALVFTADDGIHGSRVWLSDGTEGGTYLPAVDLPMIYYESKNIIDGIHYYKKRKDLQTGLEVWASDGTQEGTQLLMTDPSRYFLMSDTYFKLNGSVYFSDGSVLYKSDGTTAGTTPVVSQYCERIAAVIGTDLYFIGTNFTQPFYRSKGEPDDEVYVRDENGTTVTGGRSGGEALMGGVLYVFGDKVWKVGATDAETKVISTQKALTTPRKLDDKVLFLSHDDTYGDEWWVSDGNTTQLLKDINPGSADVNEGYTSKTLYHVNGKYYLHCNDGTHGQELWVTDGTEAGTGLLKDFTPGSGSSVYFTLKDVNGTTVIKLKNQVTGIYSYWMTDGTPENTIDLAEDDIKVRLFEGGVLLPGDQYLYTGGTENELFSYNITTDETVQLTRNPQTENFITTTSENGEIAKFDLSFFLFGANYKSDGTTGGTVSIAGMTDIRDFVPYKGKLYFIDRESEKSYLSYMERDGSDATHLFEVSKEDYASDDILVKVGERLYFLKDGENYNELWSSDGTLEGTHAVGSELEIPYKIEDVIPADTLVYFAGYTDASSYEVWVSDGTTEGTHITREIKSGTGSPFLRRNGTTDYLIYKGLQGYALDDKIFFYAEDENNNTEPWVSDGSESGTFMLKDINTGSSVYNSYTYAEVNEKVVFVANNDEIWVSDGTEAGTEKLLDATAGYPGWNLSHRENLYSTGTRCYIFHDAGEGIKLWVSDGTPAGTTFVKNIEPVGDRDVGSPFLYKDEIYFLADDGVHGRSLWKSDGTAEGTTLFLDAAEGPYSLWYNKAGTLGDKLLISAGAPTQLYISDGTQSGTKLLVDNP